MISVPRKAVVSQRKFYDLSLWAVRCPLLSIFMPLLVLFVIAYPSLSSIFQSNSLPLLYLSKIGIESETTGLLPNFSITQVGIAQANGGNVLEKASLLESLAMQNRLLQGVLGSNQIEQVQSPFQLWNNSIQLLHRDSSPLKTINSRIDAIPKHLLRKALKVNGYVTSAETIVINVLTSEEDKGPFRKLVDENIKELNTLSNVTGFEVLGSTGKYSEASSQGLLRVNVQSITKWDILFIILLFSLWTLEFFKKFNQIAWTKSKFGVLLAVAIQLVISIAASSSLTRLLFGNDTENVPTSLMWFPVLLVSSHGVIRRLVGTAGSNATDSSNEHPSRRRNNSDGVPTISFVEASAKANASSFNMTLLSIMLSTMLFPFNRRTSVFLSCALLNCFILQSTYFTSILNLDYRRLSSNELLFLNYSDQPSSRPLDVQDSGGQHMNFKAYFQSIVSGRFTMSSHPLSVCTLYYFLINQRFRLVRSSSSVFNKLIRGQFSNIAYYASSSPVSYIEGISTSQLLLAKYGGGTYFISSSAEDRILALKGALDFSQEKWESKMSALQAPFVSSYKFDLYFFVEFIVMVVLLSSIALLILQTLLSKVEIPVGSDGESNLAGPDNEVTPKNNNSAHASGDGFTFHTKELSNGGHTLDIISISTSESPFIVSVGIDRRLLIWSPLSNPVPPPTEIPLGRQLWPVLDVVTSTNGNLTAIFGKKGFVSCWSRKTLGFLWSIKVDFSENDLLDSFFRTKTRPAFLRKKPSGIVSHTNKTHATHEMIGSPMKRRDSSVSVSSMMSTSSLNHAFDAQYGDTTAVPDLREDDDVELVFVTANGTVTCIDYKGKSTSCKVTNSVFPLLSCKKLTTPRVNDRLVICDKKGDVYISTVVNNKWRPRKLMLIRNSFNRGEKLMTPATLMSRTFDDPPATPVQSTLSTSSVNTTLLIPFVGMLFLAKENEAELVDAQTGTVIKTFKLPSYMPGTLRVFHDQPTHCKFCGSASVSSLSVAYTERYTSTLVMSTFRLESRTKTSICLRVERDPREIRCLGLESVVEQKHCLPDIDKWDVTDNNMIIGLKRKERQRFTTTGASSMMRSASEDVKTGELRLRNRIESRSMKPSKSVEYNIHDIWEGWTMTVNGKVTYYQIPVGVNGLLANRIGPLEKFGAKSMVAAFGNVMKLFFSGHEELIMTPDGLNLNEEESGLKFVNKRRQRLNEKKTSNNYGQL
ncbi:LANO_0G14796g1_1 [Lachancea nothofagi CBS 11611]|uniref:LANO_0G14796g1_1 n=1 Tax=Lachancea nothofagi CBS 11611 TaxID=1266666 RepID=A0A1G4KK68_9SACH|nr:LANO_0G14796g1_1 [Lachancea nothofagi CBS 11611]